MTPANNLMLDLMNQAIQSENNELRLYSNVWIRLVVISANEVKLESIFTDKPSKGFGTKVMKLLIELADQHQVDISLTPAPFGHRTLGPNKLITWYRGFGFHPDETQLVKLIRLHK